MENNSQSQSVLKVLTCKHFLLAFILNRHKRNREAASELLMRLKDNRDLQKFLQDCQEVFFINPWGKWSSSPSTELNSDVFKVQSEWMSVFVCLLYLVQSFVIGKKCYLRDQIVDKSAVYLPTIAASRLRYSTHLFSVQRFISFKTHTHTHKKNNPERRVLWTRSLR